MIRMKGLVQEKGVFFFMAMTERAKKVKREYLRKWRRDNPEKVRKHNQNYWNKKANKLEDQELNV